LVTGAGSTWRPRRRDQGARRPAGCPPPHRNVGLQL